MTDADLHAIADGTDKRHSPWHEAQELAQEVLNLRAEVETAKRLASGFAEEYRAAQAELTACRHDMQTCADKLAVASGHLGIVAARQTERFWTRTPPTVPGWWWWREASDWVEVIRRVALWPTGCGLAVEALDDQEADFILTPHNVGGEWAGPITPPTLVAPEEKPK